MKKQSALIGFTGFVGSTLLRERNFDYLYNSHNIDDIKGGEFSTVVCAGVSAVKWWANKNPIEDKAAINRLVGSLDAINTDHFVLISTVDVYPEPFNVTEADVPDHLVAQPYGRHRRELERWATERFPKCTIVRLPGLFGHGLKKNLIYDLLTGNQTENISPNGILQWYALSRFANDLDRIIKAGLSLVNIAPEGVKTETIAETFFPGSRIGVTDMSGPKYDMRTIHAEVLGGKGIYHMDSATVLADLGAFIARERS